MSKRLQAGFVACVLIALFHVFLVADAVTWRGPENYAGPVIVILGLPLFLVELRISRALRNGDGTGGAGEFSTQIPLVVSCLALLVLVLHLL